MSTERLIRALEDDPVSRLKWIIFKQFGVLPSSRQAKALTDKAAVLCGAQMLLDKRQQKGSVNSSFDEGRFESLSRGFDHEKKF